MPMHDDDFARIQPVIEMAQRLHTSLHGKLIEKGVQPIDALIASFYANHWLATQLHGGDRAAAVEWMRSAADTIERQLIEKLN